MLDIGPYRLARGWQDASSSKLKADPISLWPEEVDQTVRDAPALGANSGETESLHDTLRTQVVYVVSREPRDERLGPFEIS